MSGILGSNDSINDNNGGVGDDNANNNTSLFNAHQRGSSTSLSSMGGFLRRSTFGIKKPFKVRGGSGSSGNNNSDGGSSGGSSAFGGLMTIAPTVPTALQEESTMITATEISVQQRASSGAVGREEQQQEVGMTSSSAAAIKRHNDTFSVETLEAIQSSHSNVVTGNNSTRVDSSKETSNFATINLLVDAATIENNASSDNSVRPLEWQTIGAKMGAKTEIVYKTETAPQRQWSSTVDGDDDDDDNDCYFRASHDDSSTSSNDDYEDEQGRRRSNINHREQQSGRTEADSAFLSALHVASANPSSTLTNIRRQAYPPSSSTSRKKHQGNALPSAEKGPPQTNIVSTPPSPDNNNATVSSCTQNPPLPVTSTGTFNATAGEREKGETAGRDNSISRDNPMAQANATFLGALRAESVPFGEEEDFRGMGGIGDGQTKPYYPTGSFIMNPASKAKPLQAKQHLEVQTTRDSSSHSNDIRQAIEHEDSLDADSKFLMAIRGSQYPNNDDISSVECGETYNSGTLVFNSPPADGVKGTARSDIESSNASFMSAIHAAADEDDGEDMFTTDATAVVAVEGETDSERENRTDAEEADDDIFDEDMTGINLPVHPFMEKVLLPRPLFFGHVIPPRIVAEAERAASAYAITTTTASDSLDETTTNATSSSFSHQHQQPDSLTNADSESFAADDSSVMSSMSFSSVLPGGGKIFDSSVAPCCRNFEGAIDVFGFGVNPFIPAHQNAKVVNVGVGRDENEELAAPHPYVSVYSPVWGEWGRMARAKARRKMGKIADKARSDIEIRMAAEEAEKHFAPMITPIRSLDQRQDYPLTTPSRRKQHKKTASTDFSDLWSQYQSPSSSSNQVSRLNDGADDSFLRHAPEEQPKTSNSEALSQDGSTAADDANNTTGGILETLANAHDSSRVEDSNTKMGNGTVDSMLKHDATVIGVPKPSDVHSSGFSQDEFLQYTRAGTVSYDINRGSDGISTTPISQDQFLQLVRIAGADDGASEKMASGTFVGVDVDVDSTDNIAKVVAVPPPFMNSNTFVQAVKFSSEDTSDNDFIEAAEERKTVGLNDNMSAAVAMLAGSDGVDDDDDDADVYRSIGAPVFLAAGGGSMASNKYGRPYSNLELTNGCTPLYGCDDPALPHESDLGIIETKEDEKRGAERRRQQHMIGQFASPGIMPHIACPTQCLDADDSTSWNARFTDSQSGYSRSDGNTMVISLDGQVPTGTDTGNTPQQKSPLYEVSRLAWWNFPDVFNETGKDRSKTSRTQTSGRGYGPTSELSPALDNPIPLDVQTNLWPPLKDLRENNISCNRSHSATSTARFLPHLSDRPPSVRHLQIDTTAVGFPSLGGEIEPFFCQLAIFHFEMTAERVPGSSVRHDSDSVSTSASSHAPSPNMERCGQVTEFLNFDIVQDPTVIKNCKHALWPYTKESDIHGWRAASEDDTTNEATCTTTHSEGTSCGLFPLGSDLSISNLYAVIIVNKVIVEHAIEMSPYYKPGRETAQEGIDLETLRSSAAKSCSKYGQILMPFAFGVVPLKHILGDESPKAPVSRAVQIPLFKYDVERGSQSIFDHILRMLHPTMEPRGGKAASMTRGHALLVMRYFGYLGLHSILKKRSSLAREHLVDITGELQVKCKAAMDFGGSQAHKPKCPALGQTFVLPSWHSQYEIEPALHGGRNVRDRFGELGGTPVIGASKFLYAQEIASLPLERSISESTSRASSKSTRSKYDGKLLHTSLINELVCHPKILLNCTNKRIFIKVEFRELVWSKTLKADIAIPIQPCIHNSRRGPWLVQEAFSACAMGTQQFLDEFKIKLPMVLGAPGHERCGLLFSVFHFKAQANELDFSLHNAEKSDYEYVIEQLGSGFLPLTLENDPSCLIANGYHNVPIAFRATLLAIKVDGEQVQPSQPVTSMNNIGIVNSLTCSLNADESYPKGSLVLTPLRPLVDDDDDDDDDNDDDQAVDVNDQASHPSCAGLASKISRSQSQSSLKDTFEDVLILQVTIIAITSVHPQNRALADFFLTKPMPPRCLMPSDFSEPYVPWGKVRSEIIYRLKPERIPPFNFVGGSLAETERKMLEPVVSLTKSSKCPHSDLMTHLVRIVAQLWRTAVSGAGEPSILWASPESLIPLRLNAFATLLHTVSSASHYMAKAGLRQLDGSASWDITGESTTRILFRLHA